MLRKETRVAVYSENNQISAVPLGDIKDFNGGRATLHDTNRLAPEIGTERNQLVKCVQHRRHVFSIFGQMKQNELGTMLLRQ